MNAKNAYEQWDDFGKISAHKRVDVVVTPENKVQPTAEYRAEKKKEDVQEVHYPATKSNFALYMERSV